MIGLAPSAAAAALTLALTVLGLDYLAPMVLLLTAPLQRLLARRVRSTESARSG